MEQHITRSITEGSAIAVSSCSFKEEWGTSAVIIEGNENSRHRIKVTSTAPGTDKDQYAYMIELTGLYHTICTK